MLSWLPAAPQDFRSIVKKLAAGELLAGQDLQRTVNFALNLDQLLSVSRAFEKSRDKVQPEPLSSAKLAVLLDGTTDFIVPAIRASAPRHGTFVDIYDPGFGQSVQAVMDPNSGLAAFKPDIVLVGSDHRTLGLDKAETDPGRAGDAGRGNSARGWPGDDARAIRVIVPDLRGSDALAWARKARPPGATRGCAPLLGPCELGVSIIQV